MESSIKVPQCAQGCWWKTECANMVCQTVYTAISEKTLSPRCFRKCACCCCWVCKVAQRRQKEVCDKFLRPMVFQAGEVLGMLLKARPRMVSRNCQHLVSWSQWSLLQSSVDHKKLSRLGPKTSPLVRLKLCHAIVSICPALLIHVWFQSRTWTWWWM